MALLCHAQKTFKNEVSLGYYSAGEFFDTSAFKISSFSEGRSPSICYTRLFHKNLSVGLSYTRCYFNYLPTNPAHYPKRLKDNTIRYREQQTISTNLGYEISKGPIYIKAKAGIRYNLEGFKSEHLFYYGSVGFWEEPVSGYQAYGKFGAKLGASIQHPIIWRFFGELDCEYAKMFSGGDQTQMLLSYRIGFKF